jgi:hypothetical protein
LDNLQEWKENSISQLKLNSLYIGKKQSTIYSGKQVAINLQQPVHKRQKLIMPGTLWWAPSTQLLAFEKGRLQHKQENKH